MHKLIVGCGYLGKRVAKAWLGQGHRVAALTRSPERAKRLESCGLTPVVGDVTDRIGAAEPSIVGDFDDDRAREIVRVRVTDPGTGHRGAVYGVTVIVVTSGGATSSTVRESVAGSATD